MGKSGREPENIGISLMRGVLLAHVGLSIHLLSGGLSSLSSRARADSLPFEACLAVAMFMMWATRFIPRRKALLVVSLSTACMSAFVSSVLREDVLSSVLLTLVCCVSGMKVVEWRERALSPSWAEARLQTLSARIRPHFLFNTLNAIASLIRRNPVKAEEALMDLSDIFRAFLKEESFVPLSDELLICRKYLDIEKLRLGTRLKIAWDIPSFLPEAEIPSLLLQPLLENAVRHGIETSKTGGEISVRLSTISDRLIFRVRNPIPVGEHASAGNGMALSNIKERLVLRYDLDAGIESTRTNGVHETKITMPLRRKGESISGR